MRFSSSTCANGTRNAGGSSSRQQRHLWCDREFDHWGGTPNDLAFHQASQENSRGWHENPNETGPVPKTCTNNKDMLAFYFPAKLCWRAVKLDQNHQVYPDGRASPHKLYWFFTFDCVSTRRRSCRWALVIPARWPTADAPLLGAPPPARIT